MPLPRQQARPQSLAQMFGIDPEVGQQPSSIAFNDYLANIGPTNEQRREAGVIDAGDARTEAGLNEDRQMNSAVREARAHGFEGSYPLQEQAQYSADQKLRQLLLPKQMELESARTERETGREFDATQRDLDRKSREGIATGAQATGLARTNAQQQAITGRTNAAAESKRGWLSKLFGGPATSAAPAAPMATTAEGTIEMVTPDGRELDVPMAEVGRMESLGATRK